MKPAYYPKASSVQFDSVCSGEARSMIDKPREQIAASGPNSDMPVGGSNVFCRGGHLDVCIDTVGLWGRLGCAHCAATKP
jgi:hypothetical protein